MNNNFPPNTDPNTFAFIGAIAGAIISNEFNIYELNSLGNWFELLGQYLLTYVAQAQLIKYRTNPQNYFHDKINNDINHLYKAIKKIEEELNNIKKES